MAGIISLLLYFLAVYCPSSVEALDFGFQRWLSSHSLDQQVMGEDKKKHDYSLPWKYQNGKEAKPTVNSLLSRVHHVTKCQQELIDRFAKLKNLKASSLSSLDGKNTKELYAKLALGVTNCHLYNHGREISEYESSMEMTEAHFAIYTQFLLDIERIGSELNHERW